MSIQIRDQELVDQLICGLIVELRNRSNVRRELRENGGLDFTDLLALCIGKQ